MKHEILFRNPTFHNGLNVTVRNGFGWFFKTAIGDELALSGKNGAITNGLIVGRMIMPFKRIPENILQFEHDPSCRNFAGLLAEMKRVYPGFSEENSVTVLLFYIAPK